MTPLSTEKDLYPSIANLAGLKKWSTNQRLHAQPCLMPLMRGWRYFHRYQKISRLPKRKSENGDCLSESPKISLRYQQEVSIDVGINLWTLFWCATRQYVQPEGGWRTITLSNRWWQHQQQVNDITRIAQLKCSTSARTASRLPLPSPTRGSAAVPSQVPMEIKQRKRKLRNELQMKRRFRRTIVHNNKRYM